MPRYASLDILRGLAILLMVPVHFSDNLSPRIASTAWLFDAVTYLGSLPAPLFTFVSGLSFSLWARKLKAEGRTERSITFVALKRGAFLFALGIAFNFCIWLPEETLNWDILTLLASAYFFLAFARYIPPMALGLIAGVIPLLAPAFRTVGDYTEYWDEGVFSYDYNFRDSIFGFISNGYFPLVPWLIFPIVGFIVGEIAFAPRRNPKLLLSLIALGLGSLLLALALMIWGNKLPDTFGDNYGTGFSEFPASTEFLFIMLGICFLAFAVLHRIYDLRTPAVAPGFIRRIFGRFGEFSLTIYLIHHAVHLWPLWIYGAAMGQTDVTHYWQQALSTPLALLLAGLFLIVCDLGLRLLQRRKKWSIEWCMRRICG